MQKKEIVRAASVSRLRNKSKGMDSVLDADNVQILRIHHSVHLTGNS